MSDTLTPARVADLEKAVLSHSSLVLTEAALRRRETLLALIADWRTLSRRLRLQIPSQDKST
jgi:hypothetical protein